MRLSVAEVQSVCWTSVAFPREHKPPWRSGRPDFHSYCQVRTASSFIVVST